MQSSGWKPGTALGASSVPIPAHEATAAKVRIAVKDDTLGLGASLKSRNVEHQRTGLDAFQGLLGRLNAKDEAALKAVEQKIENKKLAMFAQGRWGGMVFVPGGLLIQDDPKKEVVEEKSFEEELQTSSDDEVNEQREETVKLTKKENETPEERALRKAQKKQRKEERKIRKEAKRLKKLSKASGTSTPASDTADFTEQSTGTSTPAQIPEVNVTTVTQQRLKNGRHILRGRNIQAKRLAFSDTRGLDQIFMRQAEKTTA